ncbi:MAG: hypothetical protein ACFB20_06705 [Opitutales bacterium]
MPLKLIGRQAELDHLMHEVGHGASPGSAPPVTSIVGPESIGKSTFLDAIWQRFNDLQIPAVCLRPPVVEGTGDARAWLQDLTQTLKASHPALHGRLTQFRHAFSQRLAQIDHGTQAPFGTNRQEMAMLEWWTRELHRFCTDREEDDGRLPLKVRLVWLIDEFERWPAAQEKWFTEYMAPVFAEFRLACDLHFYTSLEKPPTLTSNFASFWVGVAQVGKVIELKPFTTEEVSGFIEEAGITDLDAKALFEQTQGNPGKIHQILEQRRTTQLETDVGQVERLFKGRTNEEREWMLWAAHLRWISREFLRFFGGKAAGDAAFACLKLRLELGLTPFNGGYQVNAEVAEALCAWQQIRHPESFERLQRRARVCTDLFEIVGSTPDLEVLSLLSRFRFFNHKLLQQLLPGDSRTVRAFTVEHPEYFFETDNNLAVADTFRTQFREYNALVAHPQERELKRKIEAAWNDRRDAVLREMHEIEDHIKRDEKALDEISVELSKMKQDDRVRRFDGNDEATPKVKVQFSAEKKSGSAFSGLCVAGIVSTVLGIFFLYLGILFTDQFSMTYCALGVMFVGGGITLPQARLPKTRTVTMSAVRPKAQAKPKRPSDSNQRLLNMKLTNLENKRSLTIESLARQRQRFSELDGILCEPYVD